MAGHSSSVPASSSSSSSGAQFTYSNASYFPLPFHLQQSAPPAPPGPQFPAPYAAAPPTPAVPLPVASVYPAPAPAPASAVYTLPQYQQAQQLFQRDAQTITPEALESVKAALASSEIEHKAETKKKAIPRKAAGQSWEDPTLAEWPENDYRLFCGDLGNEVNDDVLSKAFSRFPSFNMAKVVRDKRTGKTKGYGFVSFSNPTDLAGALKEMNGKYVGNRPLTNVHLRRFLIRSLSSYSSSSSPSRSLNEATRTVVLHRNPTSVFHHFRHQGPALRFSNPLQLSLSHSFFSDSGENDVDQTSQSLAAELLRDPDLDPLPITERLQLSFSHIKPNPELVLNTLNLASEAGRTVLGFNDWLVSNPDFNHTDETISYFVDYFGRRKDFNSIHEVLAKGLGVSGDKTLQSTIDRFARAGRHTKLISFFETMEKNYGFKRDKESLRMVVEKLCENGFASHAEKVVKDLANEFFPDEAICDTLIKGWCVDEKLDEAKRLAGEMYRGGFELGTPAYNALLDCVCKLCRKKDPFRLQSEAEVVLVEMDYRGVPRNGETFNVLINNLCKIRKTSEALNLFHRMGEWGCLPDAETFVILIKSLYQAARTGEGDEMIDRMRSSGYGDALDKKAYYDFLKILCGIERIDHALIVFEKMKNDGCEPGIKTYDLLMGKFCAHNRLDKANSLYNEAQKRGVPVVSKVYKVDPRYVAKPKVKKAEKKRETLPEKMARKRRRLKQIRLSFVKKPKKSMRRAY